ncbi:10 kda heat shock protein [Anaeramoeba ignava]|uniref:20 kDa chaperonin, chloroplastic n=1 Tax=Anaeramoeba ignava TaxID=1746090 RepID=A0A9Q0LPM4_ANAIG|nr:10 kda heat shock protein [Anaeramoeba ignava]
MIPIKNFLTSTQTVKTTTQIFQNFFSSQIKSKENSKKQNEDIPIKPYFDKVLILKEQTINKTDSGIYIPDSIIKKVDRGKVVAVGEGRVNSKGIRGTLSVKKGDIVMLPHYGGDSIIYKGIEYLLFPETDLLGIFEK